MLIKLNKDRLPYNYTNDKVRLFGEHGAFTINLEIVDKLTLENFIFYKKDKVLGYHPGRVISVLLKLLCTSNKKLLDETFKILLDNAKIENDMMLFPYKFDFKLHDEFEVLKSGWVSGLCQGMALSLFSRYYGDTKETQMIRDSLFHASILEQTKDGYFFHEYEKKCDAFNGHIYAIYGLYDHWLISEDKKTEEMLIGGLRWVEKNWHKYRREGGASIYCTMHKKLCDKENGKYHALHIGQLLFLYNITKNKTFKHASDLLLQDFNPKRKVTNW